MGWSARFRFFFLGDFDAEGLAGMAVLIRRIGDPFTSAGGQSWTM